VSLNNFLVPIQVRLSSNFVNHTLGYRDEVIKFWKVKVGGLGVRSTERPSSLHLFCELAQMMERWVFDCEKNENNAL